MYVFSGWSDHVLSPDTPPYRTVYYNEVYIALKILESLYFLNRKCAQRRLNRGRRANTLQNFYTVYVSIQYYRTLSAPGVKTVRAQNYLTTSAGTFALTVNKAIHKCRIPKNQRLL